MLHRQEFTEAFSAEDAANVGPEPVRRDPLAAQTIRALAARVIEQMWWEAETAARQAHLTARPNWGERPLRENERNAIETLINYQSESLGLSPFTVETEMLQVFGADEMGAIKAWNFDEVIRYLVELDGNSGGDDTSAPLNSG